MGVTQSFDAWQMQMIDLESRILLYSGLKPEYTRQTFTTIEMEGKPFKVRTIYYSQPASSGSNNTKKKTLVLTHGYMSNCTTFVTLMKRLAYNYDLVLFDNCGWGLNTRLDKSEGMSGKEEAYRWIRQFICRAIDGMDLPKTFLLAGHSYGAFLTLLYATERPERIESLFLLSPPNLETHNPDDYQPLAYNDQMHPNMLSDPSWIPYVNRKHKTKTHIFNRVYQLPRPV